MLEVAKTLRRVGENFEVEIEVGGREQWVRIATSEKNVATELELVLGACSVQSLAGVVIGNIGNEDWVQGQSR